MTRKLWIAIVAVALGSFAFAQTTASSQTNASASGNASAHASRNGAQVNSNHSTSASQNSSLISGPKGRALKAHGSSSNSSSNSLAVGKNGIASNGSSQGSSSLQAVLTKPINAKKAKPGDTVMAKTTQAWTTADGVRVPKGSRLIGHVTEAQARSHGQAQSSLGFVFDKAVLKHGRQVPIHGVLRAVAPPRNLAAMASGNGMMNMGANGGMSGMGGAAPAVAAGGGGLLGGAGGAVGGVAGNATPALGGAASAAGNLGANAAGGLNGVAGGAAQTTLGAASSGVVGLRNVQMVSSAAGNANGSMSNVLTSTTQNVQLQSGTQMVLNVAKQ